MALNAHEQRAQTSVQIGATLAASGQNARLEPARAWLRGTLWSRGMDRPLRATKGGDTIAAGT
eukprot:4616318-Lingulodinium_polyedra.AAC.1